MSIFNYIKRKLAASDDGPNIKFGRHVISLKEQEEQLFLGEAIRLYEEDELLTSIEFLLNFLRNDIDDNIAYDIEEGELFFELYQGSKKIIGRCNNEKFIAISEIAKISESNVGLYRKLLERNYLLKYCRYSIEGDKLMMKFDSFTMDASPQKLFYALKEMAINADKYDDLLADEFKELDNILTGKITYLSDEIKNKKETYLRQAIKNAVSDAEKVIGADEMSIAIKSYFLLYCNYKIDYLIKPEGYVMEILERNHREYFENNSQTINQKYEEIKNNFQLILDRSSDQLHEELYQTCHTFDYTKTASHHDLKALIERELPKAQMYYSQGKHDVCISVCGYIASYSLFHYSLPTPDLNLLDLLIRVIENDFYVELGFTPNYSENSIPVQAILEKKIETIEDENKRNHPYLKINYSKLSYHNLASFSLSYLQMLLSFELYGHKQLV